MNFTPDDSGNSRYFNCSSWMAGCACLTGALRFLFRDLGPDEIPDLLESPGTLIHPAIIAAYPFGICMCWAIPVICAISSQRFVWMRLLALLAFIPVLTYAESLHWRCSIGSYIIFPFHQLLWLNAAHAAWLAANLLLLSLAGYRLERKS